VLLGCVLGTLGISSTGWATEPLRAFAGTKLEQSLWADGDSFPVRTTDGNSYVVRLYHVDCPEITVSTDSDKRRIREQARYFGVEDPANVVLAGVQAKAFVAEVLKEPFTLHTALATAPGRSGKPRVYAFVTTADGSDLASLLVEKGLARAHGMRRATPAGTPAVEQQTLLGDRELKAMMERVGVWKNTNPAHLVELRAAQRAEDRELDAISDAIDRQRSSVPIDINLATKEELVRLDGIGPQLAERIVQARPFVSYDDLSRVPGIGSATIQRLKPQLTDPKG